MKKKNNLLVSVVIPCYNHEKYIQECIRSVINQDYENIELIIIDDGSNDNSVKKIKEMVEACKKRFVRFEFRHRQNRGLSDTLNESLKWFKGGYFSGVASDDVFLPKKISLLVEHLENTGKDCAVAFGDARFIDENSNDVYISLRDGGITKNENKGTVSFLELHTHSRRLNYQNSNVFGTYESILSGNYLPAMGYIMRVDVMKEVGGWSSGNTVEDWEMWLQVSKKYCFSYFNEAVALYRIHGLNSMTINTEKILLDSLTLLEKEKKYALSQGLGGAYYSCLVSLRVGLLYHQPLTLIVLIFSFRNWLFFKNFFSRILGKINRSIQ